MDLNNIEKILTEEINKIASGKGYKGRASFEGQSLVIPADLFFSSEGRKPGKQPPLLEILDWVKANNIGNRDINTAYVIARAIGRRGIKGSFWLDQAIEIGMIRIENEVIPDTIDDIVNMLS